MAEQFPPHKDPLQEAYRQLEEAESLRMTGKADRAREICEGLVKRFPDYFGALFTLGLIFIDKKQYAHALGCLVRASMLNPQSWRALTALSAVYLEMGATEMAAHTLEVASRIEPDDSNIHMTLGEVYREEREYELARDAYGRAYELDPDLDIAALGLGASHESLGEYEEAAKVFEGLLNRGSRSISVFSELNNLPSVFVKSDLRKLLKEVQKEPGADAADYETSLLFVTGAILDKAGEYREAWKHIERGNKKLFRKFRRDARSLSRTQQVNIKQLRQKKIIAKGDTDEGGGIRSLFILGPSRSGKTTLESLGFS